MTRKPALIMDGSGVLHDPSNAPYVTPPLTRDEQIALWTRLCNDKLPPSAVRQRDGFKGSKLSYVSGTYIIGKLNEIFGLHWTNDIISMHCSYGPVTRTFKAKDGSEYERYVSAHECQVKLSIVLDGVITYKSGVGSGSGIDSDPAKALESSAKEAETDALKRAAYKFGNALGLALYPDGDEPYAMIGSTLYNIDGSHTDLGLLYDSMINATTMDDLTAIAARIKDQVGTSRLSSKDENDLRKAWAKRRSELMPKPAPKAKPKAEPAQEDEYDHMVDDLSDPEAF